MTPSKKSNNIVSYGTAVILVIAFSMFLVVRIDNARQDDVLSPKEQLRLDIAELRRDILNLDARIRILQGQIEAEASNE